MNKSIKIDVGRIIKALLANWYLMAIAGLLLGGIFYNLRAMETQKYSASASLYSAVNGSVSESTTVAKVMQAYASVISSNKIADRAASILGDSKVTGSYIRAVISVSYSADSPILYIYATDSSRTRAAAIVNAVADAFIIEAQNLTGSDGVQILDKAIDAKEISKRVRLYTVLGLFGGAMIMAMVIIIREIISDRVYRVEDAELNGKLEIIGIIPDQKGV